MRSLESPYVRTRWKGQHTVCFMSYFHVHTLSQSMTKRMDAQMNTPYLLGTYLVPPKK
jgi:hypothetical protein